MRKDKSFTIIEMLVVIAIIGLISSLVLLNINPSTQKQKANIAKTLEFSQSIQSALGVEAVGVWNFDNNTTDASGYGNNGIITGGVTFTDNTPQKIIGQGQGKYALKFDVANAYVNVGAIMPLGKTTITLWFKSTRTSTDNGMLSFTSGGTRGLFAIPYSTTGNALLYLASSNYRYFTGISGYLNGEWHFLVLYIHGSAATDILQSSLTIDNKTISAGATTQSETPISWSNFYIGQEGYSTFSGSIDEVRIYKQGLAAGQIQKLYVEGQEKHKNLTVK